MSDRNPTPFVLPLSVPAERLGADDCLLARPRLGRLRSVVVELGRRTLPTEERSLWGRGTENSKWATSGTSGQVWLEREQGWMNFPHR